MSQKTSKRKELNWICSSTICDQVARVQLAKELQTAGHLSHSHERSEGSGHQFPLVVVITKASFLPLESTQTLLKLPYDLDVLKYQLLHLFCNNRRIKGSSYCG